MVVKYLDHEACLKTHYSNNDLIVVGGQANTAVIKSYIDAIWHRPVVMKHLFGTIDLLQQFIDNLILCDSQLVMKDTNKELTYLYVIFIVSL